MISDDEFNNVETSPRAHSVSDGAETEEIDRDDTMTALTADVPLSKRQRRRIKDERSRARRALQSYQTRASHNHQLLGELPNIHLNEVIADTGAADNLTSRAIADDYKEFITRMDSPIDYTTASGNVRGFCELNLVWTQLGEAGSAVILPDTPSVLSIGRWVIDRHWRFEWPPEFPCTPLLENPNGELVWLVVRNYVP